MSRTRAKRSASIRSSWRPAAIPAGANLALGAALALRDAGASPLRFLLLHYGAYSTDGDSPSWQRFGSGAYVLSRAQLDWVWSTYLSHPGQKNDWRVAPLLAPLAGLPPAHLAIGTLDPLLDDNERLAASLAAAGVPCRLVRYDGLVHGYIRYGQLVASVRHAIADSAAALRGGAREPNGLRKTRRPRLPAAAGHKARTNKSRTEETMTNPARSEDLLALYDRAPLDRRYWTIFSLLAVGIALDFFDFFIVSYLVAVVGPQWHLTYGQSAAMLLLGRSRCDPGRARLGLALGRRGAARSCWCAGTFICAAGSGAIALVPDGDWLLFTALRFVVGVGLAGCATPITTLIVELTPTRHRTFVTGLLVVFATVGSLHRRARCRDACCGFLGWRGVAAIGVVPAVMGVLFIFSPARIRPLARREGPLRRGAGDGCAHARLAARRGAAPRRASPRRETGPQHQPNSSRRPRFFWLTVITWTGVATAAYGIYLWGPTIIALLLKIPVAQAAHYFVYVALAGIIGKVLLSWLRAEDRPQAGRRNSGLCQRSRA